MLRRLGCDAAQRAKQLAAAALIGALGLLHLPGLAASPPSTERATAPSGVQRVLARLAPRTGEGQVGVYGGKSFTHASDVLVARPNGARLLVRDVRWQAKDFTEPVYYGARISRWLAGSLGGMLDFTHAKAISDPGQEVDTEGSLGAGAAPPGRTTIAKLFRRLEFSHGHNMLTLNGLWRLPFGTARLRPYVGIGAGIALPHTEIHVEGDATRTYEYQATGPVVQGLAGIEIRTERGLSFFVEYKLAFTSATAPLSGADTSATGLISDLWRQLGRVLAGERARDGELSTRLLTHQLIGGASVRLEPVAAAP